jgi:hypothetical protein
METGPPPPQGARGRRRLRGLPGARRRCFLALMVGAPRSPASAPPRARRRRFLALVGAPESLAPAPPRGPTVDVCYVDGGCFWISVSTSQGARRQCFLALMVGAPGSPAPTPPRGATVGICYVNGGRSQISSSGTSRGPTVDVS